MSDFIVNTNKYSTIRNTEKRYVLDGIKPVSPLSRY
jgi:hypothetical protein